jgi:hypothetical protein
VVAKSRFFLSALGPNQLFDLFSFSPVALWIRRRWQLHAWSLSTPLPLIFPIRLSLAQASGTDSLSGLPLRDSYSRQRACRQSLHPCLIPRLGLHSWLDSLHSGSVFRCPTLSPWLAASWELRLPPVPVQPSLSSPS